MNLTEIEQEALGLSEAERARLVLALMASLKAPASEVSDQEVAEREQELERGEVAQMLHDEFVKSVQFRVLGFSGAMTACCSVC